jgi:hypothetical protein
MWLLELPVGVILPDWYARGAFQLLIEMSAMKLPRTKQRPMIKAVKLIVICQLVV